MVALVLEDGTGVPGANAYADEAFADDYFSSHPYYADNWEELTSDRKKGLLIAASSQIDNMITWPGSRSYELQALGAPRFNWYDRYGTIIPRNSIPILLKQAVCELAMYLNSPESNSDGAGSGGGIDELKLDVITIKFAGSTARPAVPVAAVRLLTALGVLQSNTRVRRVQVGLA